MSKRKRKPRNRRPASRPRSSAPDRALGVTSYDITWDPLHNLPHNVLPPEVDSQAERLHNPAVSRPAKAVPELERWIERYPDVAKLYNFLCLAYQGVGDTANAERIARENYRRHPDYLFAKLNYADFCLK